jgi:excisionase family DNA binding protein
MLSVQEAADLLGINKRTMYSLAAPQGPIPCYRIGRSVRFERVDIDAYKEAQRCEPARPITVRTPLPVVRLKASSPTGETELQKLFREAGLKPKTPLEIEAAKKRRKRRAV